MFGYQNSAATIQFKSNDQIDKEKQLEGTELVIEEVTGLSAFLNRNFQAARSAKFKIENYLLKSLRQRKGEYEPDRLAEIRKQGGNEIYMMLTSVKCRAAESWIYEILFPAGDKAWNIEKTPLPELDPAVMDAINEEIMMQATEAMQVDPTLIVDEAALKQVAKQIEKALTDRLGKEADERALKMDTLIEDQFVEGGFTKALKEHIKDIVTYRAGILKGPVIKKKRQLKYEKIGGKTIPKISTKIIKTYKRVSPFDIFPSPNSRGIQDGYLFERHRMSVKSFQEIKGVQGYKDDVIDEIIDLFGQKGHRGWLLNDSERANLESRENEFITQEGMIDVLEYSGGVLGKDLIDWGMPKEKVKNPRKYYEANIWFVKNHIFKATLNNDPLGRRPYSKSCFEEIPGSFWGWGIPDLMRDTQNMCNASARSIANNLALASGPQVEVNTDRLVESEEPEAIGPWRIWQTRSDPYGSPQQAIRFHDVPSNARELMAVYEFFAKLADDHTGIPAYTYGNANVGGAGRTASGLSMLMTAASRGIKGVIANIDTTIEETVTRTYDYNMLYHDDESVKGDVNIIANGSKSLIAKEQLTIRMNELLQTTANPIDTQIMGLEGRAALLRQAMKNMDIKVDDVIPDPEGFAERIKQAAMQEPLAGGQPPAPQTLGFDGAPAQGQDTSLFQ